MTRELQQHPQVVVIPFHSHLPIKNG